MQSLARIGRVDFTFETAEVHHKSDSVSQLPSFTTHAIPRERYDMWRTNPEEPYSYGKLKEFIENHPHVFRPGEYQRKKREAYLQETK